MIDRSCIGGQDRIRNVGRASPHRGLTLHFSTVISLEAELVAMVASLPDLPRDRVRVLAEEAAALEELAPLPAKSLARSLAAVLRRYSEGSAPLEGWGLVAQAANTLDRAITTPGSIAATGLAAAAHELDSLAPPADTAPAPPSPAPDVPLTSLRRRT